MSVGRYGTPIHLLPRQAVEDMAAQALEQASPPLSIAAPPQARTTAALLRGQMQSRADELRAELSRMGDLQDELALLERMLAVKEKT